MTEWLLPLVPVWGLWLVAGTTFLSCLALPVPASLVMLSAGAFGAAGDLVLWQAAAAALAGAVAGDLTGYAAGRVGGGALLRRLGRTPRRRAALDRAAATMEAQGPPAIFLSRWLFSPLGPYVNLAAGALRVPPARFAPPAIAGEAIWVALYTGLGHAFANRVAALGAFLGNLSGALAAGALALALGLWLLAQLRSTSRGT